MSVVDQWGNIMRENTKPIDKSTIIEIHPIAVNVAHGHVCLKCNSSAGRKGFLGLLGYGQIYCDSDYCENSKPKFKKL